MKRLWNYLKNGEGRGLKLSLIFTFVLSALMGGLFFYTAKKAPFMLANTPFSATTIALLATVVSFIVLNIFYFIQVFLTWLLSKIIFLKTTKGSIFRVSATTYTILWCLIILFSVIKMIWPTQPFIVPVLFAGSFMIVIANFFVLPSLVLLLGLPTPQGIIPYPVPLQNTSNLIYATIISLIVLVFLSDKGVKKVEKASAKKETKKKKA